MAIRIPCGAKHRPSPGGEREENGLPRRLSAPRNDVVIFTWSLCCWPVIVEQERAILESPLQYDHPRWVGGGGFASIQIFHQVHGMVQVVVGLVALHGEEAAPGGVGEIHACGPGGHHVGPGIAHVEGLGCLHTQTAQAL